MLRSLLVCLSLFVALPAYAAPSIGQSAPDFTATGALSGKSVTLSSYKGQIVVLEWTNPDCPFVRKHYGSNNMQTLEQYARDKNVVWLSINSGAAGREGSMDAAQAKAKTTETHAVVSDYILDADGKIGNLYGAKTTPHMFVIDKNGMLVYMGAIDDKPTANPADIASAHNYVRDAIDSTIAGKPVEVSSTQSYGCSVKYAH